MRQRHVISLSCMVQLVCSTSFVVQFHRDVDVESFVSKFYITNLGHLSLQTAGELDLSSFQIGDFKGITGNFTTETVSSLYNDPNVVAISLDRELVLSEVQEYAPLHLTRLSQVERLHAGQSMDYVYDPSGGIGVDVYILDSGIQLNHPDFTHRVHKIADYTGQSVRDQTDPVGHGTYIAGVIGSETFGVAKKANLYDIKVTDNRGRTKLTDVINALNLIVSDSRITERPSVVVIPLIMKKNLILNGAVEAVVNEGIPVIASAGNDGKSACDFSPGSAKGSLTVGALDAQDRIASFSNWGPCVDIFTSGVSVETTSLRGGASTYKSGTSLSAGITAGMVAYYMGMGDTGPQAVERVVKYSLNDHIPLVSLEGKPQTPNRILFNNEGEPNWGPSEQINVN